MKHFFFFLFILNTLCLSSQEMFVYRKDSISKYNIKDVNQIKTYNKFLKIDSNDDTSDSFEIVNIDSINFKLNDERFVGGDISMLTKYEEHSNKYYDIDGEEVNAMKFFKKIGWNTMRVRLFVEPQNASAENISSGVVQDLNYVKKLSKRIKENGFKLMLDFHYSDSWADPAQQYIPKSWENADASALKDTIYNYTAHTLKALIKENIYPDFIQIGNEISYGMLWNIGKVNPYNDNNWDTFASFLKNASKACRENCPDAKIIIHIERSGVTEAAKNFFSRVEKYNIDYDIIGLSYYPFWHNSISTLSKTLYELSNNFPNKKIQIVETAYYYQFQPEVDYDFSSTWSITPEGQRQYIEDLITELKYFPNVNGLFWWFPEENGNGVIGNWINRGLFDNYTGKALPAIYELEKFK